MANLHVDQKAVKDLFQGETDFLIPDYQRPYEWGEEECQTLWDDLYNFCFPDDDYSKFNNKEEYFLGPIVTFNNEDNKKEVIDGQQRLTTLMLLLRALYDKLLYMNDPATQEMKREVEKCIWHSDDTMKTVFSELKIDSQVASDEDKEDFLTILLKGKSKDNKSRYAKNFALFVQNINALVNKRPSFFQYFLPRVLRYCILLPIEAESQDTALRIFSTLNDRGKPLADADIFKAQFYKHFTASGKKEWFMDMWKELDKIATEVFTPIYGTPLDDLFTQYMHYLRAVKGERSSTVEGLRKFYEGGGNYPLLKEEQTLYHLQALAHFWQDITNQNRERFSNRVLRRLFVLNYAPNGMWKSITSVYFLRWKDDNGQLDDEKFYTFLERITAFIFAYALTNPGINSLRTPLFAENVKIVNGSDTVSFDGFKISEETYRAAAENFSFTNIRAITRSMLTWWAFHDDDQTLFDLGQRFDIEHIYPRARQENEHGLHDRRSLERLGNKVLLEKRINIRASDYRFADKEKYYRGYTTDSGKEVRGSAISEVATLHDKYRTLHNGDCDFTEDDILARDKDIINAFVATLAAHRLLQ